MNPLIEELTKEQLRSDIPAFRPGDTVRVHAKVVEGTRERIQLFEGVVIKRRGVESAKLIQYVKFLTEGVERTFPLHTPRVAKIEEFATVKYVANCTTYVHYTEKLLVSKKSVVNHRYQTEKEPLVFKGSFYYLFLY